MRYSIKLSYNGSEFCGWQIQPCSPSVQQCLEEALTKLLRTRISVTGAGRTDTGVNAIGYVAHFDTPSEIDPAATAYKLNAILPHSVTVHGIQPESDDFHARFSVSKREYTYFLHRVKDPFMTGFSYLCAYPDLDFEAMNRAASHLIGTHDFSCFEKAGADNKTSVCTVSEAVWRKYVPSHVAVTGGTGSGDFWYFRICADRFLRNMVRAVVGTLIEVGRGKRTEEDFASLILEYTPGQEHVSHRSKAGESVPGHALFLSKITY